MSDAPLLVEQHDTCAIVTLNRPAALNALSSAMRRGFCAALAELDARDDIRVVILTGTGRAFTAGLDLKEIAASGKSVDDNVATENMVNAIKTFSKPLICAVNGLAVTGGFEIALACDMLIAAETARFADTHVRVGIDPGWGLSQRLSRAIGIYRAKELSLSGNFLSARQAESWGLVNRVVPDAELIATALRLATDIATNDPACVVRMKALIDEGFGLNLDAALHMEATRAGVTNAGVSAAQVGHQRQPAQAIARAAIKGAPE